MLILTHCESLPEQKFKKYAEDIKGHPVTKAISDFCVLGIFPFGAINVDNIYDDDIDEETRRNIVKSRLKKCSSFRNELLKQFILNSDSSNPLANIAELQKKTKEHFKQLIENEKQISEENGKDPKDVTSKKKNCNIM